MPRDHTRTYVLQTMAGQERKLKEAVERGVSGVGECYIPEREVAEKRDGQWVRAVKRLLPGYVFVRTDDPDALAAGLRGLPGFSRLLGVSGERFMALEVAEKRDGQWVRAVKRLLPGYVFVRTDDPDALAAGLRGLPGFSRLLGVSGERFMALTPGEEAWLGALANPETHVVELSQGVIEGDRVRVSAGPLMGYESAIKRIDRHKRVAWIEVSLMGRTKLVKVGLEIVRKQS